MLSLNKDKFGRTRSERTQIPTEEEWARVQTLTGINHQRRLAGLKELDSLGCVAVFPSARELWEELERPGINQLRSAFGPKEMDDMKDIKDELKAEINGPEALRAQIKNIFEGVGALERENRQLKATLAEKNLKLKSSEEALLEKEKELLLIQRPDSGFLERLKYLFGREVKTNNIKTKDE